MFISCLNLRLCRAHHACIINTSIFLMVQCVLCFVWNLSRRCETIVARFPLYVCQHLHDGPRKNTFDIGGSSAAADQLWSSKLCSIDTLFAPHFSLSVPRPVFQHKNKCRSSIWLCYVYRLMNCLHSLIDRGMKSWNEIHNGK